MPPHHDPQALQILIAGAYGVGNLGDEAILAGLLEEFRPQGHLHVFSRFPPETREIHGVHASRRNLRDVRRAGRLVVGGGELFQPGMAWKYATLVLVARAMGKPVHVRAVGVSPRLQGLERRLVRAALGRVSEVRVRDASSQKLLEAWGIAARQEPDPSERLEPEPVDAPSMLPPSFAGQRLIGVNLRRTYREERDAQVFSAFRSFVEEASAAMPDVRFVFLPFAEHRDRPEERDSELGRALAELFPHHVHVLEERLRPTQMLGLVAALDGVVTMRFHPMVFAHRVGVPALGIREYWKVEEFARDRGIPVFDAADLPTSAPKLREHFALGVKR